MNTETPSEKIEREKNEARHKYLKRLKRMKKGPLPFHIKIKIKDQIVSEEKRAGIYQKIKLPPNYDPDKDCDEGPRETYIYENPFTRKIYSKRIRRELRRIYPDFNGSNIPTGFIEPPPKVDNCCGT